MHKVKLSWSKRSLVTVLSLGFIVFGIGFISWAMFNIWSHNNYSVDATTTTADAEPNKLTENSTTENSTASEKVLYPVYPAEGDNIGSLTIPVLNRKLPIFQGTGANELENGVGHFTQSVLPGEGDNCVLSGHRDTVFTEIGELKIGDQLIVQTTAGSFTYEVTGTRIVKADDKTVIVPIDHAVLTITTCYPFNFIGSAPERYIISADLVNSK